MINRFTTSVAAIALIAGTSLAYAQGTGMSRDTPSAGSTTQQSPPSSERGGVSKATSMNRNEATPRANTAQSEEKAPSGQNQRAQGEMKAGPKQEKSAQDTNSKGERSKTLSSDNDNAKGGSKEMKAEGREDRNNMKAEGRQSTESKTVGQAGAGAKLSTEQRTKITGVIREQHVAPVTNVNFAISVGTRVPRDVSFHPLPTEIVTIYPEWRGYEFILVRDQIVVIDPRTFEIVAVLEA
jgi:hypothetical protein